MLWRASDVHGTAIEATDGSIGSVGDFLFSDDRWTVRWAVIDTGNWLPGRRVLLPPNRLTLRSSTPTPARGSRQAESWPDSLSDWALPPPSARAIGEVEPVRAFDTAEAALAFLACMAAVSNGARLRPLASACSDV